MTHVHSLARICLNLIMLISINLEPRHHEADTPTARKRCVSSHGLLNPRLTCLQVVDAQDSDPAPSVCAPRWKNARNENAKDTFDSLDETGIFTVLCRHGMLLVTADMIHSGERYVFADIAISTF
jgi:hypothetical protein